MNRFLFTSALSLSLAACVATEEPGSSSSQAQSVSSSQSQVTSSSNSSEALSSSVASSSLVVSSSTISVIPEPSSSQASSSSQVSSEQSSSVQSSSVSSAPMSSSSSAAGFDGDIASGRALIRDASGVCFACHQDANEDGLFEAGAVDIRIDVNSFSYPSDPDLAGDNYTGASAEDLARYIENQMPLNPAGCVGQCAEDIAAYLWSLRGQDVVVGPTECTSEDPVLYGRRALKFLTSYEYHNALQALFDLPLPTNYATTSKIAPDDYIGSLPNHTHSKVGESRVNSYDANAADLAQWALETDGALPFSCSSAAACSKHFVEKFAYYAFRRPLTDAEVAEYTAIITNATSVETGLRWAIRSALMSPQFLYRSELGDTAASTLEKINSAPEKVIYEPAAEPIVVNGNSPANSGYTFTGNDLLLVTVEASPLIDYSTFPHTITDTYPALQMVGNGISSAPQPIGEAGPVTLTFHMADITGPVYYLVPQAVAEIDGVQYGGTHTVLEVSVAPARVKEIPETFKQKVAEAAADAYVLDEFEYASALAFMLTASSPDKELMKAALVGDLNNPEQVENHVERLINSDLGREQVKRFAGLWYGTDQVRTVNRFGNDNFTPDVKAAMAEEIRELYAHVFYDTSEPYTALFEADFTMVNKALADFYGISGASGDEFVKVSTAGTERGGLIASGGFMALYAHDDRTSPIKRAVHVRQDLLCQSIPQPGALDDGDERKAAAAHAEAREKDGDLTTTEFYDIQTNVPDTGCAVCHNAVINPLFAMDNFDNVGLERRQVDGLYVQTGLGANGMDNVAIEMVNSGGYLYSGDVIGPIDTNKADAAKVEGKGIFFKGAKALSKALVAEGLPGLDACLVQKTYRYGVGSPISIADVDARFEQPLSATEQGQMLCMQDNLEQALGSANDPKAMLKQLSLSDVIRFRQ